MRTNKSNRGFTLVELMVVVMIVGALAAIAIPSYDSYVARGRLAEGISMLSELQLRQEQVYQDNRAYTNGMTPRVSGQYWTGTCTTSATPAGIANQLFTCTVSPTATSGLGYQYTVDQAGTKSTIASSPAVSGWTVPSSAACWVRTKNGTC